MITPGLWKRALRGSAQWRLLLAWLAGLAVPAIAVLAQIGELLSHALDKSPRAKELVAVLDAEALVDLGHVVGAGADAVRPSVRAMALLAVFVAPFLAAMAVAAARSAEALSLRELLRGAGEFYTRMLRLLLVAVLPLGVAAAAIYGAQYWAKERAAHVLTESSAVAGERVATAVSLLVLFVAHLTLDLARGTFAAQPDRRSAFWAWWHALGVLWRRPLHTLGMALAGTLSALLAAGLFTLLRYQIVQSNAAAVGLAFVLSQLALASIGWGRAARIFGFAELVRADAAARARPQPAASVQTVPAEPVTPASLPPAGTA